MRLGARVRDVLRLARTGQPPGPPQLAPPGAFYSPVVDAGALVVEPERSRVWPADPADPPGIDLRGTAQLELLAAIGQHPFDWSVERPGPSYDPTNDQFPPHDAAVLYGLLRTLRPARMVEVGSGWSTTVAAAAIHDGDLGTALTCIEPYPRDFLHRQPGIELRQEKVEHTPLAVFDALEAGDVCFIDSSHVAKTGSDVVHLFSQVLPRLADGVVVHVHDIFLPEDYPEGWVRHGFNWNEQYLLQAYLTHNARARVLLMNRWTALRHPAELGAALSLDRFDGSSFWFATGPTPPPAP
jgi:predicted O-methyltransferase YrrM